MRQVSKIVIESFLAGKTKHLQNTSTNGKSLFLHGNEIISKVCENTYKISSCDWRTNTTKERLNAFFSCLGVNFGVYQKKGEWYFSNKKQFKDNTILTVVNNVIVFQ